MVLAKTSTADSRREFWMACGLVLLPFLAYARLATAGFVWDDDTMLTANPLIRAGDGLWRIWFTREAIDYWPVTYTSLWAEWRIWGLWAPGYHLTNVLLHVTECVFLWRLLARLKVPGAYIAALWFALHPLNVESVAWIAQRKNLLAMLFFLLSLRSFSESSVVESGKTDRWCVLAWAAFVLSLLSKGSTAPLPLLLLGLVLWRRRLRWCDASWLGIFFLTATVMTAVNIAFSQKSGGDLIRAIGWPERLAGAGGALWFYLGKALWPSGLCFVYPHWIVPPLNPIWWVGLGLVPAVTVVLWLGRGGYTKQEFWAWLYFGVMLLPVLGLVDVYFMRYSLVADHYAHLALVGVVTWVAVRSAQLRLPRVLAGGIALVLGLLTFRQTAIYADNFSLFGSVLARNPECWMAHNNLGKALLDLHVPERLPEAISHFEEALRLNPGSTQASICAVARTNLGSALDAEGRTSEAIAQYEEAIRLKPGMAEAHYNLGAALQKDPGRLDEAIAQYKEAIRLKPDYAEAFNNLGNALSASGKTREAIAQHEKALRLNPGLADAHINLGSALDAEGRTSEAIAQYEEALRLAPGSPEAHYDLGAALQKTPGRLGEAIAQYGEALRLRPGYAEAHNNLGNALNAAGRTREAIAQYEEALRLNPGLADAHNNLGSALDAEGRTAEAIAQYEQALRLKPDVPGTHYNLGIALHETPGRLDEAITQYQEALRLRPDYAEAHYNLGVALGSQGRVADAISHYDEALRANPGMAEAHNNLGLALDAQGRTTEAIQHYEEALRTRPDYAEAHYNLASALLRVPGRTQQAIVHLEAVLRIQPENEQARRRLAEVQAAR